MADIQCSFCGISQKQKQQVIIAGPVLKGLSLFICQECVALCTDVITEQKEAETKPPAKEMTALEKKLYDRASLARNLSDTAAELLRLSDSLNAVSDKSYCIGCSAQLVIGDEWPHISTCERHPTGRLNAKLNAITEVLSTLVHWHDRGGIDESWWDAAREELAPKSVGVKP